MKNCTECGKPADALPEHQTESYPICALCMTKGWTTDPKEIREAIANDPELSKMLVHTYGTVTVKMTTMEDNLTDLANAYAQMGYVAKMTEHELIENIKHVIADQFFQSITNSSRPQGESK